MTGRADSFPRQLARTRSFTAGAPRTFRVARDGSRIAFLRSPAGDNPSNGLWVLDPASGDERLVVAGDGDGDGDGDLPQAERARRERVRELGAGIVSYDTDARLTVAVVAAGGRLYLADLAEGSSVEPLETEPEAFDPRLSPAGDRVAYVAGRSLRLYDRGTGDRLLVEEEDPDVSWGSADFIAAEEMGRTRGHWWSPDGTRLVAERVDVGPVGRWYVSDPTEPGTPPVVLRYPAAGTANALVSLALLGLDGQRTPVRWDQERFPYLVEVRWEPHALLVAVQSRDQRTLEVLEVDPATGSTASRLRESDPHWVDIVGGTPVLLARRLLSVGVDGGLALDGRRLTPQNLHVRRICHVEDHAWITASEDDPTVVDVYRVDAAGRVERVTEGDGVHDLLAAGGDVVVTSSRGMSHDGALVKVRRGGQVVATVASRAERPVVRPEVRFAVAGVRRLRTALLLPQHERAAGPLPVLMDPYGGPHHQRVTLSRAGFLTSQWLADQGFAVVVVDGRGTPGRGPEWERAVHADLAGPALDDQIDALHALAGGDDRLDLTRVAIRGWSFGGYLAALAVLRRPDVFHAAIAGAPVTDWSLYDTHYTERYLGDPVRDADAYRRSSILDEAARLERPLLLIHGFLDDNVVAAHSLRLSRALVEAGRPHRFLPLPGSTHLTRDEAVTENLLRLQVEFLHAALNGPGTG